jgi:hypothetical protein
MNTRKLWVFWICENAVASFPENNEFCGVRPSAAWKIGDLSKMAPRTHSKNGLKFEAQFENPDDLHQCIESFVDSHLDVIKKLSRTVENSTFLLSCVLYSPDREGCFLSHSLLAKFVDTKTDFDFDFYLVE